MEHSQNPRACPGLHSHQPAVTLLWPCSQSAHHMTVSKTTHAGALILYSGPCRGPDPLRIQLPGRTCTKAWLGATCGVFATLGGPQAVLGPWGSPVWKKCSIPDACVTWSPWPPASSGNSLIARSASCPTAAHHTRPFQSPALCVVTSLLSSPLRCKLLLFGPVLFTVLFGAM